MPEIKPFRAFRYDAKKIGDFRKVLAPPYDVISEREQKALHRQSPFNVVRLILGLEKPSDDSRQNRYKRAKRFWDDWVGRGVLVRDAEPALYVYRQDYRENGKFLSRFGFLAALKLDEKAVLKHENTLSGPKKDRFRLIREVRANLSPVFGLFEDRSGAIQAALRRSAVGRPAVDATLGGVRHRLYVESRRAIVQAVVGRMGPRPMLIADGHHRFEVACQYRDFCDAAHGKFEEAPWHYVMAYFSDWTHNPFAIYPTHRLLKLGSRMKHLGRRLLALGKLERVKNLEAVLKALARTREESGPKAGYRFGFYSKKDGFHLLRLDRRLGPSRSAGAVHRLDVSVLHRRILEPLGICAVERSDRIDFTRDASEACRRVEKGEADLAVFLRPTSLREMVTVSKQGLKMPQKSTYFYPKLLSGLAFHGLTADECTFGGCCANIKTL